MNWYRHLKIAAVTQNHNSVQEVYRTLGTGKRGENSLYGKWTDLKNSPNFSKAGLNQQSLSLQMQIDQAINSTLENMKRGTYDNALSQLQRGNKLYQTMSRNILQAAGTLDPNTSQLMEQVRQMFIKAEEEIEFITYIHNNPSPTPELASMQAPPSYAEPHQEGLPDDAWLG
jgi:hypothetical protein